MHRKTGKVDAKHSLRYKSRKGFFVCLTEQTSDEKLKNKFRQKRLLMAAGSSARLVSRLPDNSERC
jgi:hypothetical protein